MSKAIYPSRVWKEEAADSLSKVLAVEEQRLRSSGSSCKNSGAAASTTNPRAEEVETEDHLQNSPE